MLEGLAAGMTAYAIAITARWRAIFTSSTPKRSKGIFFARKKYPKIRMFLRAEDVLGYIRRQNEEALDDFRWEREKALKKGEDFPKKPRKLFAGLSATIFWIRDRTVRDFSTSSTAGSMAQASIFSTNPRVRFPCRSNLNWPN